MASSYNRNEELECMTIISFLIKLTACMILVLRGNKFVISAESSSDYGVLKTSDPTTLALLDMLKDDTN